MQQGKENEGGNLAVLSLDERGRTAVDMGGPYHQVEAGELFPTESINSEASVAHLVGSGDLNHRASL